MRISALLDNAIYSVAPGWGARRRNARRRSEAIGKIHDVTMARLERRRREYAGGGFASAETSNDAHSWLTSKLSPDSALEADRPLMIERADGAVKNFELAQAHVEGRVIRVAGCGMTIDPDVDSESEDTDSDSAINDQLRRGWDRVSECIGRHGEALWEIQHLMQRYWERRGEWFLLVGDKYDPLAPITLKVEVIHPDRVENPPEFSGDPTVRQGIKLDAEGCGIGCFIRDSHPNDTLEIKDSWTFYPFWQKNGLPRVIHHFRRVDAGQHRGFPQMQVGTRRLKNLEEYGEAELERNYVGACHGAFVRSDMGLDAQLASHSVVTDGDGRQTRDIRPGEIHYIGPGDEVQFSNPSGAPQTFTGYVEHEGRMFAAGAGTSLPMLSGDWRGLPYNGARIVWNQEEATVDVLQMGHAKTIVWLYRHFLTRMISTGQVDIDSVAYRDQPWLFWGCRVIRPARAALDPSREDRNELVLIESNIRPHSDFVERKTGQRASTVYRRIARNRAELEANGLEVHLPNMGRDEDGDEGENSPTQPGDANQDSSDANEERQAVGA